ncbi:hypothetical protein HMPREF0239_05242 [Clostridium sp. ATCC BAA-442]|uniref:Uncharacterized protein n=1 Tax=Flavonifractor plautii ATCC 29863 TaxID=411475 RepID=G9YU27_FLAPL|nr:hypothetical protein HMPREF0372_03036 [Flavonifractor plautii ATCC 29863]ERI61337.1 hypothetical protein HMPREF0239_05242 [Clostridium sp. ATCC BAA-442]
MVGRFIGLLLLSSSTFSLFYHNLRSNRRDLSKNPPAGVKGG